MSVAGTAVVELAVPSAALSFVRSRASEKARRTSTSSSGALVVLKTQ